MKKASCGYSSIILVSKSLEPPLTPKIFSIILLLILQTLLRELLVRNAMSDVLNPNFTNTHTWYSALLMVLQDLTFDTKPG